MTKKHCYVCGIIIPSIDSMSDYEGTFSYHGEFKHICGAGYEYTTLCQEHALTVKEFIEKTKTVFDEMGDKGE